MGDIWLFDPLVPFPLEHNFLFGPFDLFKIKHIRNRPVLMFIHFISGSCKTASWVVGQKGSFLYEVKRVRLV